MVGDIFVSCRLQIYWLMKEAFWCYFNVFILSNKDMMICIITFGGDVVIAVFVPVAGFAGGPFATGVAFASCYSK